MAMHIDFADFTIDDQCFKLYRECNFRIPGGNTHTYVLKCGGNTIFKWEDEEIISFDDAVVAAERALSISKDYFGELQQSIRQLMDHRRIPLSERENHE